MANDADLRVNDGGTWKIVDQLYANDGGSWDEVKRAYANDGGTWKQFHSYVQVSPLFNGDTNIRFGDDCFAGIQFNADGDEFEANNAGSFNQNVGQWLDRGLNSEVWVLRGTVTSGAWNNQNPTGRQALSGSPSWRCIRTTQGSQHATCTFTFWDDATTGILLHTTGSATYTANQEP